MKQIATLFLMFLPCILNSCLSKSKSDLFGLLLADVHASFLFTRSDLQISERYTTRNRIVQEIARASVSLNIWCYGLDEPEIIRALKSARERGVSIQMTGSPDQDYNELHESGFFPRIRQKSGLQHTKVIVIDDAILISGTGNFTTSDLLYSNNVYAFLSLDKNQALTLERGLDHEDESIPTVRLPFNGKSILSPSRGKQIQSVILSQILSAKTSVHYMIFSHTDPLITAALALKAHQGISVEGIYDAPSGDLDEESEGALLNSSLALTPSAVYVDGNRSVLKEEGVISTGGHLHHKTIIIDSEIVLTGSYNFSQGARDSNMEIFFEFKDPSVAFVFEEEFDRVRSSARILGRSPVLSEIGPAFVSGTKYCRPQNQRLAVFSGVRESFSAEYFPAGAECVEMKDRHSISAGIGRGTTHIIPGESGEFVVGLRPVISKNDRRLPSVSSAIGIHAMTNSWIWLDDSAIPNRMLVWGSAGIVERILTQDAERLFHFDIITNPGDAIIFLFNDQTGTWSAGCVRTGSTFSGPPDQFLDGLEYNDIVPPACGAFN